MPPGSAKAHGEGATPYHRREVATLGADRLGIDARLGADRTNSTNSAGECHRPNDSSAAVAMELTMLASLSPRHWLQQRWAARTFAGSIALPPFEIGTSSSSSSAYGWRAGRAASIGMPHIQQACGCDAMRRRSDERAE